MPSNRHPSRRKGGSVSAIISLVFGVVLVGFSAPHFAAGIAELPSRPILEKLRKGAELADRFLEIAASSKQASLDWVENGRGWASLGLLHFSEARRIGLATVSGRAKLDQSILADRRAVNLSPGQAYSWTRLVHAELLQTGPNPNIAPLLSRAIAQAPYDPALLFGRLELSFLTWRHLDPALREMVAEQIRFAASIAPKRLVSLSRDRYAVMAVRDAVADTPKLRRRVDYLLRRN